LLSSSSLSLLEEDRERKSWTKCPKGRKEEKYIFKVKAPKMRELQFQQETTEPWKYSAKKSEDLRAWNTTCEEYFQ
jgi:hypothetical protein